MHLLKECHLAGHSSMLTQFFWLNLSEGFMANTRPYMGVCTSQVYVPVRWMTVLSIVQCHVFTIQVDLHVYVLLWTVFLSVKGSSQHKADTCTRRFLYQSDSCQVFVSLKYLYQSLLCTSTMRAVHQTCFFFRKFHLISYNIRNTEIWNKEDILKPVVNFL